MTTMAVPLEVGSLPIFRQLQSVGVGAPAGCLTTLNTTGRPATASLPLRLPAFPPFALGSPAFILPSVVSVSPCLYGSIRFPPSAFLVSRPSYLRSCLVELRDLALSKNASVHMPRIGCGEAGGNWLIVQATAPVSKEKSHLHRSRRWQFKALAARPRHVAVRFAVVNELLGLRVPAK
jgi:hypothetical protein